MKKILLLFISIILVLTLSLTTFANVSINFSDIQSSDWFYNNVDSLVSNKVIDGFTDGTFRPKAAFKYDQLVKTLITSRNLGIQDNSTTYWANPYIQRAMTKNWIDTTMYGTSISSSIFSVPVNRYEASKLVVNSLPEINYPSDLSSYAAQIVDYASIPEQYKDYVVKTYYLGVISGYPNGEFKGSNQLTRAEATSILIQYKKQVNAINDLGDKYTKIFIPENTNKLKVQTGYLTTYKYTGGELSIIDTGDDTLVKIKNTTIPSDMILLSEKIFLTLTESVINDELTDSLDIRYFNGTLTINVTNKENQPTFYITLDKDNVFKLSMYLEFFSDEADMLAYETVLTKIFNAFTANGDIVLDKVINTYIDMFENDIPSIEFSIDGQAIEAFTNDLATAFLITIK